MTEPLKPYLQLSAEEFALQFTEPELKCGFLNADDPKKCGMPAKWIMFYVLACGKKDMLLCDEHHDWFLAKFHNPGQLLRCGGPQKHSAPLAEAIKGFSRLS